MTQDYGISLATRVPPENLVWRNFAGKAWSKLTQKTFFARLLLLGLLIADSSANQCQAAKSACDIAPGKESIMATSAVQNTSHSQAAYGRAHASKNANTSSDLFAAALTQAVTQSSAENRNTTSTPVSAAQNATNAVNSTQDQAQAAGQFMLSLLSSLQGQTSQLSVGKVAADAQKSAATSAVKTAYGA